MLGGGAALAVGFGGTADVGGGVALAVSFDGGHVRALVGEWPMAWVMAFDGSGLVAGRLSPPELATGGCLRKLGCCARHCHW